MALDIVNLIENNPVSKLSTTIYQSKLLNKIRDNFTDDEQHLFIASFYCYLHFDDGDFVIDIENIWEWLGFSAKQKCKNLLTKNFTCDIDYKILLTQESKQNNEDNRGGHNKEKILMTIDTFKILCMQAKTEKGKTVRVYFVKLERLLKETISEETSELHRQIQESNDKLLKESEKNKLLENENERLKLIDGNPIVYIFNTDIRAEKPPLKIGATEHYRERSKPFKQTHSHGRMVFYKEIPAHTNLKTVEHWIHNVLANYRVKGEVFDIDVDEAKYWIVREVNTLNFANMLDDKKRKTLIKTLMENEERIAHEPAIEDEDCNESTSELTSEIDQEMENHITKSETQPETENMTENFDKFVHECCDISKTAEIATVDIIGQYRIWAKNATKEVYHALLEYLKIKFIPIRLTVQNQSSVVNGYRGVALKKIDYVMSFGANEAEQFVYQMYNFCPSGKTLQKDIEKEFALWKTRINKIADKKELKTFLKQCPHVMFSNLWTPEGNGLGYYGLRLKSLDNIARKPSATGKKIEKRDAQHNIIDRWTTIAKAAEAEGVSAARMSRLVKYQTVTNGFYYKHIT